MAYSDFTLERVQRAFSLVIDEDKDLFATIPEADVSFALRSTLDEYVPLATAVHTEKARSELIVAPILLEIWRLMGHRIGFFSGIEFDVAPERGLTGFCDFVLSRSHSQFLMRAPVLMVVEAKNDNIKAGLGQCVAEMVAAQIFNEREGTGPSTIFGVVTTGSNWRFLKLEPATVFVDRPEYYLDRLGKIVGILLYCVGGLGVTGRYVAPEMVAH
jgi:hypothetical protein